MWGEARVTIPIEAGILGSGLGALGLNGNVKVVSCSRHLEPGAQSSSEKQSWGSAVTRGA